MKRRTWDETLPVAYLGKAFAPVRFEQFEDADARSSRSIGYDAVGACCYYRHFFCLTRVVLEEDDLFGEEESFYEEVIAWKLANGKWLKRTERGGNACGCSGGHPVYETGDHRPR
ncbi:MAG: hypothetical protein HKL98_06140 [Burkholderiales bacterium]|nr:hypothetical protein [Burkholderiales bacterium]